MSFRQRPRMETAARPASSSSAGIAFPPNGAPQRGIFSGEPQRAPAAATQPVSPAETDNPLRRLAFNVGLAFAFIQFTKLHEILNLVLHVNTYLFNIVGVPAVLLMIGGGGLRCLKSRPTLYWLGFTWFLILSAPFSTWRSASLILVFNFIRGELVLLFILGGLVATWKEFTRLMNVLAAAALLDLFAGRFFMHMTEDGRVELIGNTTMGNANDFAALLILLLPFLLLVALSPGRFLVVRLMAGAAICYGLFFALTTGSRGALVAIAVTLLYYWLRAGAMQKILLAGLVAAASLIFVTLLPPAIVQRLSTVFRAPDSATVDESSPEGEALSSSQGRNYLLRQSIATTLQHPILGIGPGEFQNFEGKTAMAEGHQGSWHDTHNSITQVSSEAGIPAALCFIAAIVSTYLILARLYKQARRQPPSEKSRQITLTILCLLLSLVGFTTAAMFLSLAYRFYLPAMTGMTLALYGVLQREWAAASGGSGGTPRPA